MRVLIQTTSSPALDLALEESLHLSVEEGADNTWRLWQPAKPALILGTGQEAAREANLEFARANHIPVLRRHSGGGAVVIGPGAINYSAFYHFIDLPGSETIRGAMSAALKPLVAALKELGIDVREAGLSDLAVAVLPLSSQERGLGGEVQFRKLSGNSQARKRRSVVVHGTLLADPDFALIEKLLRFPSSVPDYRAGREHRAFLTSLRELNAPYELDSFSKILLKHLSSDKLDLSSASVDEMSRAERLFLEKYGSDAWNFRR
jgi:lipoate-protein ligase A